MTSVFSCLQCRASEVMFADGFETGDLSKWTQADGHWKATGRIAHGGSKRGQAEGDSASPAVNAVLDKDISLAGDSSAVLSYWYRIYQGLEEEDHVIVEWSIDGDNWHQLADYTGTAGGEWLYAQHDLPDEANNDGFRFRFRATLGSASDVFWLDDVAITADENANNLPSAEPTISSEASPEPSVSATPITSPTPEISPTHEPTPTPSATPSKPPTPTATPKPSPSPTPSKSPTPISTPTPKKSPTPSPSPTKVATPSPTLKPTPSLKPSPTAKTTPTPKLKKAVSLGAIKTNNPPALPSPEVVAAVQDNQFMAAIEAKQRQSQANLWIWVPMALIGALGVLKTLKRAK